jgi:serine/threonine-protein kinase RsbT
MAADEFKHVFFVTGRDFSNAGRASTAIKDSLKRLGVHPAVVRRIAIASYEAEMNVVMYAWHGQITLRVDPQVVSIEVSDEGPGIQDIELAMQEGYSTASNEMREMGFGAGMGLPNIKKNADRFEIISEVGQGTRLLIHVQQAA